MTKIMLKNILNELYIDETYEDLYDWVSGLKKGEIILRPGGTYKNFDELYQFISVARNGNQNDYSKQDVIIVNVSRIGDILYSSEDGIFASLNKDEKQLKIITIKLQKDFRSPKSDEKEIIKKGLKQKFSLTKFLSHAPEKKDISHKKNIEQITGCKIII